MTSLNISGVSGSINSTVSGIKTGVAGAQALGQLYSLLSGIHISAFGLIVLGVLVLFLGSRAAKALVEIIAVVMIFVGVLALLGI